MPGQVGVRIALQCMQGMLSIGAALMGCAHCLALDIDPDALDSAQANVDLFEDLPVHPELTHNAECCPSYFLV